MLDIRNGAMKPMAPNMLAGPAMVYLPLPEFFYAGINGYPIGSPSAPINQFNHCSINVTQVPTSNGYELHSQGTYESRSESSNTEMLQRIEQTVNIVLDTSKGIFEETSDINRTLRRKTRDAAKLKQDKPSRLAIKKAAELWKKCKFSPHLVGCAKGKRVTVADVYAAFKQTFNELGIKSCTILKNAIRNARKQGLI